MMNIKMHLKLVKRRDLVLTTDASNYAISAVIITRCGSRYCTAMQVFLKVIHGTF